MFIWLHYQTHEYQAMHIWKFVENKIYLRKSVSSLFGRLSTEEILEIFKNKKLILQTDKSKVNFMIQIQVFIHKKFFYWKYFLNHRISLTNQHVMILTIYIKLPGIQTLFHCCIYANLLFSPKRLSLETMKFS